MKGGCCIDELSELKIVHSHNQSWDFIKIQTHKEANYLVLSDWGTLTTLNHTLSFLLLSHYPSSPPSFLSSFLSFWRHCWGWPWIPGLKQLSCSTAWTRRDKRHSGPHLIRIEFWNVIHRWIFREHHLFLSRTWGCQCHSHCLTPALIFQALISFPQQH